MVKVPGSRSREFVDVLRTQKGDVIVIQAPKNDPHSVVRDQAQYLSKKTGRFVLVVPEGYDVVATAADELLRAIAKERNVRFIQVSEGAIPEGDPKGVFVESLKRSENEWEAELTIRTVG